MKDASGENIFSEVLQCAMRALILQNSNADVERIFSAFNYVKCKLKNSMKIDLLNAIRTT